jgi:hydrogenase maturation protease
MSAAPLLILACGNPSRGDDALGPRLLELLETDRDEGRIPARFETLTDYQLQIEHALDLEGRSLVLFVDAAVSCTPPFEFTLLQPAQDRSYSSHALSPAAVLAVYAQITSTIPPPAFQLAIPGLQFELGEGLSSVAEDYLWEARDFVSVLLQQPDSESWRQMAGGDNNTPD